MSFHDGSELAEVGRLAAEATNHRAHQIVIQLFCQRFVETLGQIYTIMRQLNDRGEMIHFATCGFAILAVCMVLGFTFRMRVSQSERGEFNKPTAAARPGSWKG